MTVEQLEEGNNLIELITDTTNALRQLEAFKLKIKDKNKNEIKSFNSKLSDNYYNLIIAEYNDGSGGKINLNRHMGNERILGVIETELKIQLKEFKEQFKAI